MRETRPSGSVRGVRSDPYPYRDTPPPRAQHGKKPQPRNRTSGNTKKPPLTVPESPHCPVRNRPRNRERKAPLIGPGSRPRSERRSAASLTPGIRAGIGCRRRQGRATPRRGQHPNPRLKEKRSDRLREQSTYPDLTRSRIARPGRPETLTVGTLLGSWISALSAPVHYFSPFFG